jgi:hypothetical protein
MTGHRSFVRRFATVAASAAMLGALFATEAGAFHIPGATYTGTHSYGGGVEFTVTPNGEGLSRFAATGSIPGSTCTFTGGSTTTYVTPLPIVNHAFNDSSQAMPKNGTFGSVQSAEGQFQIRSTGAPSCNSPVVTWNATTTASPANSEECKAATAKVKQAKRKVKQADTPEKKNKAKRKLRKAKQDQQKVC